MLLSSRALECASRCIPPTIEPFAITSYRSWEAAAERRLLVSLGATELAAPHENPFASLSSRRSATIANDVSRDNSFVSVWR